jgi:hypothetical protein
MDFLNDDDDKPPIGEKKLVLIIAILLGIGFLSVFFMIVPWLRYQDASDWRAIFIDNAIIIAIAGVFFFGVVMALRNR